MALPALSDGADGDLTALLDSLLGGSGGGSGGGCGADDGDECCWAGALTPPLPAWCDDDDDDDDDSGDGVDVGAAAPPRCAALRAPPLPPGWRCINPAHGAPCVAGCAPAPAPGADAARHALVGETRAQNGVKALRALVVGTREWRDARARGALAAAWERAGGELAPLAPPLRACAASALRRPHLLALCHAWGLASNLWRAKAAGSGRRAAAKPKAPPVLELAHAAAPTPLLRLPPPPVCAAAFATWLLTLAPECAAPTASLRAAAAPLSAAEHAYFSRLGARFLAACHAQEAAATRWRAASSHAAHAPAWVALPPGGLAFDAVIRVGDRVVYDTLVPPATASQPQAQPAQAQAQEAHAAAAAELRGAMVAAIDVDLRVLGALTTLQAAPLAEYLGALAGAARFWSVWTEEWCAMFEGMRAEEKAEAAEVAEETVPRLPRLLQRAAPAHDEALDAALHAMELQCAALQLAGC
jgi:hypothetical protein